MEAQLGRLLSDQMGEELVRSLQAYYAAGQSVSRRRPEISSSTGTRSNTGCSESRPCSGRIRVIERTSAAGTRSFVLGRGPETKNKRAHPRWRWRCAPVGALPTYGRHAASLTTSEPFTVTRADAQTPAAWAVGANIANELMTATAATIEVRIFN